jgi:outer membrane protein
MSHAEKSNLVRSPTAASRPPSPRAAVIRRAPLPGLTAALALLLCAGCSQIDVARTPFAGAPRSAVQPWRAPETRVGAVVPAPSVDIDPASPYGLAELIDLAQRMNPETRQAWELARAAAARRGRAAAAYLPGLIASTRGGQSKVVERGPDGSFSVEGPGVAPQIALGWLLLDFGRREARLEESTQELLSANWRFNRMHQQITFSVSRSYFTLGASREQVAAARLTLESASAIERAVSARLDQGLATRPELLLAVQDKARAAFELQRALGAVDDARALLAESLGIVPTVPLQVVDLGELPLPSGLTETVEQVIDRALVQRPDLASRLAELRAREAAQKRARADFWPTLSFTGSAGQQIARYNINGSSARTFSENEFVYGAFLSIDWNLFDGFARENTLREADARRGTAAADLAASELRAVREVWKAYSDVKTAIAKHEFALALLAASERAYAATLESYQRAGLATVLDMLAAQRDLASARSIAVATRAELLTAAANLAFAAGD